ncbi:MAG: hypothetical protein FWC27_13995 [Firmicutes bacterium]|nr:hypothetical protein [Bacillota bacterium]
MQRQHYDGDLPQAHLGDVACGRAQQVHQCGSIELVNPAHVERVSIHAATGQHHICHAAQYRLTEQGRVKGFVQAGQLLGIVGQIVLYQRRCRVHQCVREGVYFRFLAGRPMAVPERFHHVRHDYRRDLPQGHGQGKCKQGFMGVGDVEIVFQPGLGGGAVEHGDARAAPVHPTAKVLIPALYFKHSGRIRALGVYQELLVEGQFVIPGGGL